MTALYIVVERNEPGFDTYVDGYALSKAESELTQLAATLGVTPLMEFFSMDPEEALAEAEAFNTGLTREDLPEEIWFPATEGLKSVRSLLQYLDTHPDTFPAASTAANELSGFAHVLEEAERRNIGWHLAVDY